MVARKKEALAKGFSLPKPPTRTEVGEATAKHFEGTRPEVKASKLRRAARGERISAYLPLEVAEALRVRCARERRSISDAVTDAVSQWLIVDRVN